ncbi:MAG: hypothetical protein COB35_03895 [Gammaproteobacteria bacterium]|nr:MAG: hypothetical protein COB35_03895 [Gammaproteobacteria bacterium]
MIIFVNINLSRNLYAVLMKYQIDEFVLDVQTRTLSAKDSCQNIRPKTLEVLLYLAQRAGQIISKKELLENIWDDVKVDDGVVFQSIRDIRQLFSNPQIIQNYPRKGYQFTVQIYPLTWGKKHLNKVLSVPYIKWLKCFFIIALILLVVWLLKSFDETDHNDIKYKQRIVVLPIKNNIAYTENRWLYLGGMEQLIAKLSNLPSSIFVYQGIYIPRLMHNAGLKRTFNSSEINKIFNVSGATLIVETEMHGNVSDYKLVYKLHLANDVKQGVILDSSIDGALTTLAKKIISFIKQPLPINGNIVAKKTFNDALLAEAMISYESDWKTSISFFESYLTLNPDSVIALIYLSKLYLWNEQIDRAARLTAKAMVLINDDRQEMARIKLLKGRISAKQKRWSQAM